MASAVAGAPFGTGVTAWLTPAWNAPTPARTLYPYAQSTAVRLLWAPNKPPRFDGMSALRGDATLLD